MPLPQTLLEVATDLATDATAKAAFTADPEGFLADRGLEDWSADDLGTALEHVGDALPPELAIQLDGTGPEVAPGEVFDALVAVEPDGAAEDLAFGHGEGDPDGDDEGEDEVEDDVDVFDDLDDTAVDAIDGVELEAAEAAPDAAWDGPDDALPDTDDQVDDQVDLGFGTGADDLPDDLPE